MSELKECPFCGAGAIKWKKHGRTFVSCSAEICPASDWNMAIKAWNTRPAPSVNQELLSALEFYADKANYADRGIYPRRIDTDNGYVAQQAISKANAQAQQVKEGE